ncbi:MAG: ATP-grasp domain-containing protein [Asgard group archaeon]|nr:ATP-grasp domain-containing protein [Asgard group archaeon]
MFSSLLVANRGEIAVRIIRAARELDITTYAIYTPIDKKALHVKLADEAFELLVEDNISGYLDMDQILSICLREGIESVHPGYGFLAESENFAEEVVSINIHFIGPSPKVIELLGNKVKSREKAKEAGLNVPNGSKILTNIEEALDAAQLIGYPVIVKAVFGGGGMGIRYANNPKEMESAFINAKAQAASAFGRDEVFIEKFIHQPRHIEFQIIADNYGNVVHLGERECSIQRRNQKLLEEAPSTVISRKDRNYIGELVCQFAKSVGYTNAGTVELLYKNGEFLFNEINPRIQVEHPVTEMLTGKDIVKEQIRITQGKKLSFNQSDVKFRGHAIELRINAEDPLRDFYPTPGLVKRFSTPGGPQVRFDTAIYEGYKIPDCYDSLIGKLIVAAGDRNEAISRAINALKELVILGFTTNIPFFEELLSNEFFQKGEINIHFVKEQKILENLEAKTCEIIAALFSVGLKKSEIQLPPPSKQWQIKSKIDAIGSD